MSFEQKINYQLNKVPGLKKVIKRAYQRTMYALSPKIKSQGKIVRVSPDDAAHEYFFGYYDKSPWDITDRYVLCMRASDTWSSVSPREKADILLIDTAKPETDKDRVRKIAETTSWNVQQACMLQWLGPDYASRILFNDYRNGQYVSVIMEVATGKERVISAPAYTVSADGRIALTLDFSRLYNLRPGYGYYNAPETTKGIALPDAAAVWKIDLETGVVVPLFTYRDFASFQPRPEMLDVRAVHKVNHLMLNPCGGRCMLLYRWFVGQRKYTRLVTFNTDGTDMYVLSDDDMVSHCFWKDDQTILAFENKKDGGPGYYLMKDKTREYIHCWPQLSNDGHPSYSPNRSLIVTDTYPDRARMAEIKLMDGTDEQKNDVKVITRVFAPFKYDNDTRCDLHPRWNHKGDTICFDSVFEGHRGLYAVSAGTGAERNANAPLISVIVPVYNVEAYLERCVRSITSQTYEKLEIILVDDGSPDSCPELCERLAENDKRIKVIHKKNGGLSSARNVGLETASGELIAFVDSDDWLDVTTYEYCVKLLTEKKADAVQYAYVMAYDTTAAKQPPEKIKTLEGKEILQDYMTTTTTTTGSYSVCRCVFRREVLEGLRFREGKVNEDIDFKYKALSRCSRYLLTNQIKYYYFQGGESTSTGGLKSRDFDLYDAADELYQLTKDEPYGSIARLGRVKKARTAFSLLSRIAFYGVADQNIDKEALVKKLTAEHRPCLVLLLTSPMPLSRKVLVVMFAANYRVTEMCVHLFHRLAEIARNSVGKIRHGRKSR